MTTESLIQNQIRVELSKAGNMVFRINVGKVRMADGRWFDTGAPKGFCDLFGFRPDGQIFFIEVKMKRSCERRPKEIYGSYEKTRSTRRSGKKR